MKRTELEGAYKALLCPENFQDYAPNGLQVDGRCDVKKIGFAVSACLESIELALEHGCDTLVVHHGVLWKHQGARTLTGPHGERIKKLVQNDLNLFAYHLPLDAHLEVGNAASLARLMGINQFHPFCDQKNQPYGVWGVLPPGLTAKSWAAKLETILNHPVILASFDEKQILEKIGIITGGANNDWDWCLRYGLDAYLTGEISEYNFHDAREAKVHYLSGGHHATEQFGIKNLMDWTQKKFLSSSLSCVYLDVFNPA